MNAIEFENVSKQYRLGLVGTGTLAHDIHRFWVTNILRQEDPYLKIGETNDRASKGNSEYVWALRDITFNVEQGDVVGIIGKNGAILGMTRHEIDRKLDEIIDFSGCERYIDTPVKQAA